MKRATVALALLCTVAITTLGVCQTKNDRGVAKGSGGQGANQHSEADKNQQHTTSPLPNGIVVINNQNTSPEHDAHANQTDEELANQTDEELAKFTGYLVLVGALQLVALVGQAVVFYFTLRQIGKQADIMEQHRTSLEELARAAGDNAKAARLTAQYIINAERAWMAVTHETSRSDDSLCFFSCLNQGRTPAQIVGGSSTHLFVSNPDNLPVPPIYSGSFTMPGNTLIVNKDSFGVKPEFDPDSILNQNNKWQLVKNREEYLVFYGRICYEDVFESATTKVIHETGWCYAYFPDKGFTACGPAEYQQHT
jgi:hypothetical protein